MQLIFSRIHPIALKRGDVIDVFNTVDNEGYLISDGLILQAFYPPATHFPINELGRNDFWSDVISNGHNFPIGFTIQDYKAVCASQVQRFAKSSSIRKGYRIDGLWSCRHNSYI